MDCRELMKQKSAAALQFSERRIRVTGGRVERRLAAVLAADVAGYSQLMGVDELGTLSAATAPNSRIAASVALSGQGMSLPGSCYRRG